MKKFLLSLLDWIYKKKCYICGSSKDNQKICVNCYCKMSHISPEPHKFLLNYKVYCAGVYKQELQKIIRGLKYHNQKDLAYFQAKFMYEYWQNLEENDKQFQIVPIPLFYTREKHRKYNHMILVAEEFSKFTGYKLNLELVKRIKDTKPQYKLNRKQRMVNLFDAFNVDVSKLLAGDILLIDDICTTGSTFENVIKALNQSGIYNILCFATSTPFDDDCKIDELNYNFDALDLVKGGK